MDRKQVEPSFSRADERGPLSRDRGVTKPRRERKERKEKREIERTNYWKCAFVNAISSLQKRHRHIAPIPIRHSPFATHYPKFKNRSNELVKVEIRVHEQWITD